MEISYTLNEVEQVAKTLIEGLKSKTLLFHGSMGVGKTTLIKAIAKVLGSKDEVSSPTFSLVNEYALQGDKIYHFDLYRIQDLEEAYNFGIEDYLDSKHWIIVEWPEKIESIIAEDANHIYLDMTSEDKRVLKLKEPSVF